VQVGEIISRWEKKGFKLIGLKFITADKATAVRRMNSS
jgi:nucleoside diphosphate kinase